MEKKMKINLNKKILGTVSVVVVMMLVLGGVSYWATGDLVTTANEATGRQSW